MAHSPIERPADHWEAEREREKEGKHMLSFWTVTMKHPDSCQTDQSDSLSHRNHI